MQRVDGRSADMLRPVTMTRNYLKFAEGSVMIEVGDTRVLCSASVEEKVPPFLKGSGSGWVTAEYSLLPRSTGTRNQREAAKGKQTGRTHEIQRLIGRSLRSVVDLSALGERTIWIDCDVIQADGGTRTASITGAFVALVDALNKIGFDGADTFPVRDFLAAVSVGVLPDGDDHDDDDRTAGRGKQGRLDTRRRGLVGASDFPRRRAEAARHGSGDRRRLLDADGTDRAGRRHAVAPP